MTTPKTGLEQCDCARAEPGFRRTAEIAAPSWGFSPAGNGRTHGAPRPPPHRDQARAAGRLAEAGHGRSCRRRGQITTSWRVQQVDTP